MGKRYIKLYEQILNWEWYKNPNAFRIFIHCLLVANYADSKFEGIDVKRGQLVTSLQSLAKQTSLSIQQVRTSLAHLISTGELTSKAYSKYRIITVVKYNDYQQDNKDANKQSTSNQQASNKQSTSNQQHNKNTIKEIKEIENNKRFTPPTIEEVRSFIKEEGIPIDPDYFFDHYESSGWILKGGQKMKNWKATARNWGRRENNGRPSGNSSANSGQNRQGNNKFADLPGIIRL